MGQGEVPTDAGEILSKSVEKRPVIFAVIWAALLVVCLLFVEGDIRIWLEDEGFFWYGVWRTSLGEVPILDFQAYDPGRYYWSGTLAYLLGDGILDIRGFSALFQIVCLAMGMLAATRIVTSRWKLALVGVALVSWMSSRARVFDSGIPVAAVYVGVLLIENPSLARHFLGGVFVGLAAFFGQNHGLYTFLGFLSIIAFIAVRCHRSSLLKGLAVWSCGILVGYSPLLLMLGSIPGFFQSFLAEVMANISTPETGNIPMRVPWPWRVESSPAYGFTWHIHHLFVGLYFLIVPAFLVLGVAASLLARPESVIRKPVFAASCFIGIFYVHHAFARADAWHLADAMGPFLLAVMALPVSFGLEKVRLVALPVIIFCAASVHASLERHPAYDYYIGKKARYVSYPILGQTLRLEASTARFVDGVKNIQAQYIAPGEGLLIAPHWPGLYYILKRKSPTKETYFLLSADKESQLKSISELEKNHVSWVILGDVPLDNRNELRLRNTHPLLWAYIMKNFKRVAASGLPNNCQLLRRAEPY